jgi:hypothetical protein
LSRFWQRFRSLSTHDGPVSRPLRSPARATALTARGGVRRGGTPPRRRHDDDDAHWPAWIAGELRDGTASTDSFRAFWAQPGGFAVVVALLGLMILRSARRGERLPGYVGWGFLGWVGLCVALVGPASGFTLALVPPVLLIVSHLRGRAADRPYRGAREYVRNR